MEFLFLDRSGFEKLLLLLLRRLFCRSEDLE